LGDGMKGWKILGILAIVGMFLMPMIPAKASETKIRGDIVFGKMYHPIPGITGYQHACLYRGRTYNENIVQSDPHWENWRWYEKLWFTMGKYWKVHNSTWDRGVGGVEYTDLNEIYRVYKKEVAFGRVEGVSNDVRSNAVKFAEDREGEDRPFDIVSYWKTNSKQVGKDASPKNHNPAYGYYCAELVWAAYKDQGIDIDPDSGRVTPQEISENVRVYEGNINW